MKHFKFCPICSTEVEWKNIDGVKRLQCPDCEWIKYLNPLPAAAGVVINEKKKILLVKRAVEPEVGKWSLPAGFIELYETPEEAVLRELEEETGIKGKIESLIGVYAQSSKKYGGVLTVGYLVRRLSGELKHGDDVSDVKFDEIKDLSTIPFESHRKMLKKILDIR